MGVVARSPEHHVKCFDPLENSGGNEQLRFEIDGKPKRIELKIGSLSRSLVANLPDVVLDLIEIAAYVYAIDASVSRGGPKDQQMGAKWHRRFLVEVPVRDPNRWQQPKLKRDLEETLMFLSGDRFEISFVQRAKSPSAATQFFELGPEGSWTPDTVMLFSGGLDSFAGALEQLIEQKNRVALVSHFSSTKLAPVQKELQRAISERIGPDRLMHLPVRMQLSVKTNREGTHRTRSFLFAVLGLATATAFKQNQISFYENGIVSLNLPPVSNVLGTRATRTTHPQTLARYTQLFSRVLATPIRVENPYFWRTKKDVVRVIERLGMADQIAHTRSCADVHNLTKQYSHCGRCSQCIDRRFAIMAAKLERFDPGEAYRVDLMTGSRKMVQDKEAALSYVRNALIFESALPHDLEQTFPMVASAVSHLGEPAAESLSRITNLLKRHGKSVVDVMRDARDRADLMQFPDDSLPGLFGSIQRNALPPDIVSPEVQPTEFAPLGQHALVFAADQRSVMIDGVAEFKGSVLRLLLALAETHLAGAGEGLDLLDYPMMSAGELSRILGLASEETLRRSVSRSRNALSEKLTSAGIPVSAPDSIIENHPWHGYRLNPIRVIVRMRPDNSFTQ